MPMYFFHWTESIADHLDQHGISVDEFELIVQHPDGNGNSRKTGRPFAVGQLDDGRTILCVFEFLDSITIVPVTAYEID